MEDDERHSVGNVPNAQSVTSLNRRSSVKHESSVVEASGGGVAAARGRFNSAQKSGMQTVHHHSYRNQRGRSSVQPPIPIQPYEGGNLARKTRAHNERTQREEPASATLTPQNDLNGTQLSMALGGSGADKGPNNDVVSVSFDQQTRLPAIKPGK